MSSWIDLNNNDDNCINLNTPTVPSDSQNICSTDICINMDEKYKSYDDINILSFQSKIVTKLKVTLLYTEAENIAITNDHLELLNKLLEISDFLCKKHLIKYEMTFLKNQHGIHRTSYNFCSHGAGCKFYYKKNPSCRSKHLVYGELNSDIVSLVSYVNEKVNSHNNIEELSEIKKSLDTIYYVTEHMHSELISRKNRKIKNQKN